jgi:protoporphyrinogen IX oxidase
MDIRIALFIHILFVATWFGGTSLMAMVLRDATRSNQLATMAHALEKVQHWNLTMFIPTAIVVLLSGIYLWLPYAQKPLWLLVKERFGSLFIILFMLVVTFYGKKLLQQIKANGIDSSKGQAILKRYILMLNLSVLSMMILIFFVTLKIDLYSPF